MLFGCKNSEIGIFLDNFHKIYQNGNYKREVIEMVTRMKYLQKLLDWKDEKVIKVITGIRRCGKSTLLLQYQEHLKEQGIDASRILLEDKSLNTEQNMEYSKALIKDGASVGIITNDFHLFRAKQIARKYGLDNICGIAAKSTPVYLPNNMLREFLAEIKFLL